LRRLSIQPQRLQEMGRRAHQASIGDAASRIARLCFQVVENSASPSAAEPANAELAKDSRLNEVEPGTPSASR
jgi:hypothetical protein